MRVQPFNGTFFLLLAGAVMVIVGLWAVMYKRSEMLKRRVLLALCFLNIVIFILYKAALSRDTLFLSISGVERFNWFNELPLQLCNIHMLLMPVGLLFQKKQILGFTFFLAPIGALTAILFPEAAFCGYSLWLPRIAGFYVTHLLLFICGVSIGTLGLYRPRLRDIPGVVAALFITALTMHGVNVVLRATVCAHANYFFTFGADISLINVLWKYIPIPFLFETPLLVLLGVYMVLLTLPFERQRAAERRAATSETADNTADSHEVTV